MAILDNINNGYIQKAPPKQMENDRDYKGACNIEGNLYWVSGYIRENDGRKFLKLLFKPRED
jgi:hypothetical protein